MSNTIFYPDQNLRSIFRKLFFAFFCLGLVCTLAFAHSFVSLGSEETNPEHNAGSESPDYGINAATAKKNFKPIIDSLPDDPETTVLNVNFQDSVSQVPLGWLADYGQPFGPRTAASQGTGNTYGWINAADNTPLDLSANARQRLAPADTLLRGFVAMQPQNSPEGIWEAQVANGNYDVTVSAGDEEELDSRHFITVEGVPAIVDFIPGGTTRFKEATVSVTVADGRLTIDAKGGTHTKINYVSVRKKMILIPVRSILFTQSSQSAEVEQGNVQSLLDFIYTSDTTPVSVNLIALDKNGDVPNWLLVSGKRLNNISYTTGSEISFQFDATNLAVGNYSARVTASASDYLSAVLDLSLTVKARRTGTQTRLNVNFQDSVSQVPLGWLADYGQPFGPRTAASQGTGNTYGWINAADNTPLDLSANARQRLAPADTLLRGFVAMQPQNSPEGIWEAQVANGNYDVTVSAGDEEELDSRHFITVEGVPAIVDFIPGGTTRFKEATVSVTVADGRLTIDAKSGTHTKINYVSLLPSTSKRPSVARVNPENGSQNLSDNTSISTSVLNLPNGGINNATLNSTTVYLEEETTRGRVAANVNGTGGGDAITLVPRVPLKLNTSYVFTITDGVKDLSGASFIPYTSTFTTGAISSGNVLTVRFDKTTLPNTAGRHSSLTIGPDGKLYALSIDGVIKRFIINSDGTLQDPELLYSLQDAYGPRQERLAVGLTFDPASTATNLIAYVTHSTFTFLNAPDWDSKLTRLSGDNLENVQDLLVHLPRSAKDHLTNSVAFGPDGALYFTQGSTSAMGRADNTWSNREEHLLSATVLRLDLQKLGGSLPLDVKTPEGGGTYSPFAAGAPLTIYASGVRNAYDLLWHSNGELYVPTNGSAAGGNTPASVAGTIRPDGAPYNAQVIPSLTNVQQTQKDFLFRVKQGGYYGHPNALRGEYVMNGGNPTSAIDPAQVDSYPVGTLPDQNWRGYSFDFQTNKSPNGVIEYRSNNFGGALKGKLLVVRYSQNDDIITLTPGDNSKDIVSFTEGKSIKGFSGFIDPLDLTEDTRTGNLYVSEYGGDGSITLLRADTTSVTPSGTINVSPKKIYDNEVAGGEAGTNRLVTIKNTSLNRDLSITGITLTGTDAGQFITGSLPSFPKLISPLDSITFALAFHPSATGLKRASLTITSSDTVRPTTTVPLRGLGTVSIGGTGEPSLQALLGLLEIPVATGDDDPNTSEIHSDPARRRSALLGEEVDLQRFIKAANGPVTIEPLAVFGPTGNNPVVGMGWYQSGDASSRQQLFTVLNTPASNGQTVNVNVNGVLSFDPGALPFGFYSRWPFYVNRHLYSEDSLNTFTGGLPHHVRVYPYKNTNGTIAPFTYIVAFEEDTAGFDYQDLVFVVRNVKAAPTQPFNVAVSPIADALVRNGSFSGTNFGFDTTLRVSFRPGEADKNETYLKFPLGKVGNIVSARLRLYGRTEDGAEGLISVFGVDNDAWTESGLSWNNAPAGLPSPLGALTAAGESRYYEVDVTAFVKEQFTKDRMVSFVIRDVSGQSRTVTLNSRENILFQPELVISTVNTTLVSGAQLFVENLASFPSNEDFAASRVQIPSSHNGQTFNSNHDDVWIRLHNKGMNPLTITSLSLTNQQNWKIVSLKGAVYEPSTVFPIVIGAASSADLQVQFTATDPALSGVRMVNDELSIVSNDDRQPITTLYLRGLLQERGETVSEPSAQQMISVFGFKTQTGFGATDPDSGSNVSSKGDEVLSSYFVRADPTRPVTVRQMGAYHGCCDQAENLRWYPKANTSALTSVVYHIPEDAQRLLPRQNRNLNYTPSQGSFSPTTPFGIKVGALDWTDTLLNPGRLLGIRVWKAIDKRGEVIPNAYIVANDYLGTNFTNYDYNDNMYYLTNIRPELGPASASLLAATPRAVDFGEQWLQTTTTKTLTLQSLGQVYGAGVQDPNLHITALAISGENKAEFSATLPQKMSLSPQETTQLTVQFTPQSQGLKTADLLIYYGSTASPLRVPLHGLSKAQGTLVTVPYRVKSGSDTAVVVGGKTYRSDKGLAFDNLEPYTNRQLTRISGTEEDTLYLSEQSSNGERRPFRYELPLTNGTYWVRLHFAEIYWATPGGTLSGGTGSRVMSLTVEGELRLLNLDVTGQVGTATAYVVNLPVTVTDGKLNLNFTASANRPMIGAVEVFQFSTGATLPVREPEVVTPVNRYKKLRVYPNPLHGQFSVEFPASYRGVVRLQLSDAVGRLQDLGTMQLPGGGTTLQVDVTRLKLAAGVHFLRITKEDGKTEIIKLLIQ